MSIWSGFEGYRDPTEDEVVTLLRSCTVVLDTNVLLDLYSFNEPARDVALDVLAALEQQLFVPHQVMREFWRNRHSVIAAVPKPSQPLAAVREDLLATVNSLLPDRQRSEETQQLRSRVEALLAELSQEVDSARGAALDVARILEDTSLDPVLSRLERILDGRVGAPLGDEAEVVQEGLRRFAKQIPPGYADGADKADQEPEHGTGDYLLWEQTLRQVTATDAEAFVLVTGDSKEDWRSVISKPTRQILGVRPELVAEALTRTGARFVLLKPTEFYRLMRKLQPTDDDSAGTFSLVSASELLMESREQPAGGWTTNTYRQLLANLRADSNDAQADVIEFAAVAGGFIRRDDVYVLAGYAPDRSLRRFSLPAQRAALALIDAGELREDAPAPLEAMYEGPGRTIGYRVPDDFVRFASEEHVADSDLTWIDAATIAAASDPLKVWTVNELVEVIVAQQLRDVSSARTPAATLGRDLRLRGAEWFERVGSGYRLRPGL